MILQSPGQIQQVLEHQICANLNAILEAEVRGETLAGASRKNQ